MVNGCSQTCVPKRLQKGETTPAPPAAGPGPADALFAQRRQPIQHPGGEGDGVAQQCGQGQADDDGNNRHPAGGAEVTGQARPPMATPPLPAAQARPAPARTAGTRRDPGHQLGHRLTIQLHRALEHP